MPSSADKLKHVIKYAVEHGWTPEGHDGNVLTSTSPKPDLLKYSADTLVSTEAFLGLLTLKAFLVAIFGETWEQKLIEIVEAESAGRKLQLIYIHVLAKEISNR